MPQRRGRRRASVGGHGPLGAGDPGLGQYLGRRLWLAAGGGHNWQGGQTCGRDGPDFSLNADQRELPLHPESGSPRMGDNPAAKLLRSVEGAAYWAAVAPALARLPAALGYRIACWRGDLLFRCQAGKRTELAR